MSTDYRTSDGETIRVPGSMDPFRQLGISSTANPSVTKRAVLREMAKPKRQDRAMASLAYHMITSSGTHYEKKGTVYKVKRKDIFYYAAIGDKEKVITEIDRNTDLLGATDTNKRTVLYLAARCGFDDLVETLVRKGADVNHRQIVNSTPLHVAAFYGQNRIVKILLVYGADPTLQNDHKNTPIDESSGLTKKEFEDYKKNPFQITTIFFNSTALTEGMRQIMYKGKKIGTEIFRSTWHLDHTTNSKWRMLKRNWEVAYHGTKLKYIKSIFQYGLLPSGAQLPNGELIKPPSNHFQLGTTYAGVEDWARAIFVSPSFMYASHQCYSEYTAKDNSGWCVVVKALVNPTSYKAYNPTTLFKEEPITGEPNLTEYRVEERLDDDKIFRVLSRMLSTAEPEMSRNAVVISVLFIDSTFRSNVRSYGLNHDELRKLL